MTRDQLEHAIRAACDVAGDTEVIVFGSQAILGSYPDAPESLRASVEVDMQPKNFPANTDLVDGALGELSQFHSTHGFYVHGVTIDSATLPAGWNDRTVSVSSPRGTRGNTGHCLEAHDLAASKLVANREKDRVFVTTLLREQLIDGDTLLNRVDELPVDPGRRESIADWIRITVEEIG
jgi:hypothetical protein